MSKTVKINELVKVLDFGSGCVGCMAWETFYVKFQRSNGAVLRWQSDLAEQTMYKIGGHRLIGSTVQLSANVRDNGNVQRVNKIVEVA